MTGTSQTGRILALLKRKGSLTNVELNKVCYRYSSRILELRREGHVIKADHLEGGIWRYTYHGEDETKTVTAVCKGCNELFTQGVTARKYCSHKCFTEHMPARGKYSDVVPRIMARATVTPEGCWRCDLSMDKGGYSKVRYRGQMRLSHRVMYERLVGKIEKGLELDHLCKVRNCVNPKHLEPVTPEVNRERSLGTGPARAARMAATHCKWGHEYTPENTIRPRGRNARRCRTCQYASNARTKARAVAV